MSLVRLFLDHPFAEGQALPLTPPQAHYLTNVMRLGAGVGVAVFNGRDGEWAATLDGPPKRPILIARAPRAPLRPPPDLWLLFAPVKKARTEWLVEKAVELGVGRLMPVRTERTQMDRLGEDRLRAHVIEAAEQCGATALPGLAPLQPLDRALKDWDAGRPLWVCDEALAGTAPDARPDPPGHPLAPPSTAPAMAPSTAPATSPVTAPATPATPRGAILIGPEGGFTDAERTRLAALPYATRIPLGPRILRAETAALAAVTLWQARHGDWR